MAINALSLLEEIRRLIEHHSHFEQIAQVNEPELVYATVAEAQAIAEGILSIETETTIPHQEVQKLINSWR